MEHSDISITKLKDEIKENYKIIDSLLKERNALKKAYSMQIDLVEALESRIEERDTLINNLKNKVEQIESSFGVHTSLKKANLTSKQNKNVENDILYNDQLISFIPESNLKPESNLPRLASKNS